MCKPVSITSQILLILVTLMLLILGSSNVKATDYDKDRILVVQKQVDFEFSHGKLLVKIPKGQLVVLHNGELALKLIDNRRLILTNEQLFVKSQKQFLKLNRLVLNNKFLDREFAVKRVNGHWSVQLQNKK